MTSPIQGDLCINDGPHHGMCYNPTVPICKGWRFSDLVNSGALYENPRIVCVGFPVILSSVLDERLNGVSVSEPPYDPPLCEDSNTYTAHWSGTYSSDGSISDFSINLSVTFPAGNCCTCPLDWDDASCSCESCCIIDTINSTGRECDPLTCSGFCDIWSIKECFKSPACSAQCVTDPADPYIYRKTSLFCVMLPNLPFIACDCPPYDSNEEPGRTWDVYSAPRPKCSCE
jgi:hypothetical protein